jgi:transcriptional regulator with XRE-family HTH domain
MITGTLKEVRKKLGLSQGQLSEKTGISQVLISNIESGKNSPQASTRAKIEKVLGKIDWLNTRSLPRESKKKSTVPEAELQFFKAIETINNLEEVEKFRFLVITELFFSRYINAQILIKKIADIKSGKAIEEVFDAEERDMLSKEAQRELKRREIENKQVE